MKIKWWGFKVVYVIAMGYILGHLVSCNKKGEEPLQSKQIYTCSMHPEIRKNQPGNCPICGMSLVLVRKNEEKSEAGVGTTEMHLDEHQIHNAGVRISRVEMKSLQDERRVFGEVAYIADNHLDLTSFYAGRIEKVLISYNTIEVEKGTPLLEIYSEEAIQDQGKYLEILRNRYLSTFYERRLISSQLETVKARLLKAGLTEGDLLDLEKKGKVKTLITVHAMNRGTIVGTLPHTGERVTQESVVFHITPLDRVWFVGQVFEKEIEYVQMGQKVKIETPARPGKVFEGKVVYRDQILNPETRSRMIRVEVENPQHELLPQMSAVASIQRSSRSVLAIPGRAIIETGRRKIVYIEKREGVFEPREVTVIEKGMTDEEGVWVAVEGVKEGERVVSEGSFLIDAEAQIRTPRVMEKGAEKP